MQKILPSELLKILLSNTEKILISILLKNYLSVLQKILLDFYTHFGNFMASEGFSREEEIVPTFTKRVDDKINEILSNLNEKNKFAKMVDVANIKSFNESIVAARDALALENLNPDKTSIVYASYFNQVSIAEHAFRESQKLDEYVDFAKALRYAKGSEKTRYTGFIDEINHHNSKIIEDFAMIDETEKQKAIDRTTQGYLAQLELDLKKEKEKRVQMMQTQAARQRAREEDAIRQIQLKKRTKRNRRIAIITASIIAVVIAGAVIIKVLDDLDTKKAYNNAITYMEDGKYERAIRVFESLGNYEDSLVFIEKCRYQERLSRYQEAVSLLDAGKYDEALEIFQSLGDFSDSEQRIKDIPLEMQYQEALSLVLAGYDDEALVIFRSLGNYKDSVEKIISVQYLEAQRLFEKKKYGEAIQILLRLVNYESTRDLLSECRYQLGLERMSAGKYISAADYFSMLGDYKDSADLLAECRAKRG